MRRLSRAALTVLVVCCAPATLGSAPPATVLSSLDAYLVAFATAQRTSLPELHGVEAAAAALLDAERALLPRVSFRESLGYRHERLGLDLAVGLDLPLHDASAGPSVALAAADLELQSLYAEAAREAAAGAFLSDLAALAVLSPATEMASTYATARRFAALTARDALLLPPAAREAFEAVARARTTAAWLEGARHDTVERLARRLSLPAASLRAPPLEDVAALLDDASERLGKTTGAGGGAAERRVASCVSGSAGARVAAARHAHALRGAEHDAAADLRLTLTAGLDYSATLLGPPSFGADGLGMSLGVHVRYLLPPGAPLGGSVSASAGTSGVSQDAQVSWPPSSRAPLSQLDPAAQLAGELADLAAAARAHLRELAAAGAERVQRERRLAWALIDAAPALPRAEVERLARVPLDPSWPSFSPVDDLHLAQLRLEVALARLGELSAAAQLAAHCGSLPAWDGA